MTCAICEKFYTEDLRRRVTCAHCSFSACRACTKTYIETANVSARCMNCFREWDRDFINRNFPLSWINGPYRSLRARMLVEKEKALLPSSQHMVANYRLAQSLSVEIGHLDSAIERQRMYLETLERKRNHKIVEYDRAVANKYRGRKTVKNVYSNRACPDGACRGFLDTEWRCGLCRAAVCKTCYVVIGADGTHACKPEDVASMQAIEQSSRPCPNCNMAIVKSDGCDQMWCTACHTAFWWTSGDIVRGRIHNPLYYNLQQDRPREVGDVPCGGLCNTHDLVKAFACTKEGTALLPTLSLFWRYPLFSFYVLVGQDSAVQRQLRRLRNVYNDIDHCDLRLEYLLGNITEKRWQSMLYSRENLREKNIAVRQIYETFLWSVTETLSAFVAGQMDLSTAMEQLNFLFSSANIGLSNTQAAFGMKCPSIVLPDVLPPTLSGHVR